MQDLFKNIRSYTILIFLFSIILLWQGCVKKDYASDADSFKAVDNLAFFKAANGKLASVSFLNTTVNRFKILDEQHHFANRLKEKYGEARWEMTMVVKNKDSLFTLITPFINQQDSVTALLFAYHQGVGKTIYRVINKENYTKFFTYKGDRDAKTINRSSIEGWFNEFGKVHQRMKLLKEGKTLPRAVYIYWKCVRYVWSGGGGETPTVGATNWQCTYSIVDDGGNSNPDNPNNSNGGPPVDPNENSCNGPDCGGGGGGGVETWTFEEKQSPNQIIIDSLKDYPCAQNLLGQLPDMKNTVSEIIKRTFKDSTTGNDLIFAPLQMTGKDGWFKGSTTGYIDNYGSYKVKGTVYLDDSLLNYGTKEIILSTMLHESLHAYLALERARLSPQQFSEKYPSISVYVQDDPNNALNKFYQFITGDDHGEMVTNYRTAIREALLNYNPNLPYDVADALAVNGFFNQNSFPNDVALLQRNERESYLNKYKGNKCP